MIVCVKCRKKMCCKKNSVGADFGMGHVYPGDTFQCATCEVEVLATNYRPSFDPNRTFQDEYIVMEEGDK